MVFTTTCLESSQLNRHFCFWLNLYLDQSGFFLDETASVDKLVAGKIVLLVILGNALLGARRKPPMIN